MTLRPTLALLTLLSVLCIVTARADEPIDAAAAADATETAPAGEVSGDTASARLNPLPSSTRIAEISQDAQDAYERFDHRRHEKVIRKQGFSCHSCHQIGGVGDRRLSPEALDRAFITPQVGACHYCHNPPEGVARRGPGECFNCHPDGRMPPSHGAGWIEIHGSDARLGALDCTQCHQDHFCVRCHVRKDSTRYAVHDRSWLAIHGISALSDPVSCTTCHLQPDCVKCHATGDGRLQ